jgi:hypothetical protein
MKIITITSQDAYEAMFVPSNKRKHIATISYTKGN